MFRIKWHEQFRIGFTHLLEIQSHFFSNEMFFIVIRDCQNAFIRYVTDLK